MTAFSQDELSLVLDALLRTVLESRYGQGCWTYLSSNKHVLQTEVWRILMDRDLWLDLSRRISLGRDGFAGLRREPYLERVATLFAERTAWGFRLPALRIDPQPWNRQAIDRWRRGRNVLAIMTGPETLPIVETVKAVETGRVGIDTSGYRVVGVPQPEWIAGKGSAAGGVIVGDDGKPRLVELELPVRIDAALILNLPRDKEIALHRRLTQEAWAAGVTVLNPGSIASEKADRKHLAHARWRSAGIGTPASCFLPGACSHESVRQALLAIRGQWAVGSGQSAVGSWQWARGAESADGASVYILPDCSTEGDRARRFILADENLEAASAYIIKAIHPTGDALVRQECGNMRLMLDGGPRRAVLRLNVSTAFGRPCTYSACWQVARESTDDVASVGCGGSLMEYPGPSESLVAEAGGEWSPVPREAWKEPELTTLGQRAMAALQRGIPACDRLSFVGLDLLPTWHPGENAIRWSVLEANARPAGLGAARPIKTFPSFPPGITA